MKEIRFAILGAGQIAEKHAAAIGAAAGARLVAAHGRAGAKLDAFAGRWGIEACTDLDALLARQDVDAVTIATPSGAHLEPALAAARAGKHILCEKPLEVTLERVDAMLEGCRRHGVILAGVFQARLNRNVQLIRRAIREGRFGKPLLANVQVKWFRDQAYYDSAKWRGTWALDGGGVLMNQAIHVIDLLRYLAGPVTWVQAVGSNRTHDRIEVEDTVAALLQFANGAVGTIEASTSCAPGFPRRLELSGDKGSIVLEDDRLTRWSFVDQNEEDRRILEEGEQGDGLASGAADPRAIGHEGHRRLVEDLARAIRDDSQPSIPGEEARHAVELICGLYQSMRTGKPVYFPASKEMA